MNISEKDTATFIDDFLVNIGPLAKNCNAEWNFRDDCCKTKIDTIETNIDEIIRLCKNINVNKASCIEH